MAKSNILSSESINYLKLIANGKIYRVPPYQRDYSWEEEQWEDLWDDIRALSDRREDRHYMGAIVLQAKSDREFQIIDGQQRLATLSVFALAVLERLRRMAESGQEAPANQERATGLRNRFIGEKDPASLVESSKLFLNESDDAFYQDYLIQLRSPLNPRGLPKSSQLLWRCFRYFAKRLEESGQRFPNGAELAGLLAETVARQLLFIQIVVEDELNAYTVFETLNARGLELSATDLLKNYLFSHLTVSADLQALQRRWRSLIGTVNQERFPEFLRYHLLCEHPKIRTQRLFKLVRERVKTPDDVFTLMNALEARAELFAALSDPNHGYWIEAPDCRPYIRELNLFRVRQMTPLLFAAWEKFSREDFARVLKLVSVIAFRYTVVSGLNTNSLEPTYHEAAKAVLDGSAPSPAGVFARLKPIYVNDDKFEQDLALFRVDSSGAQKKLAKYILARLEGDSSGRACDPDTDPATIEHILPENPSEQWSLTFPKDQWEGNVYRLGNLTLLEAPLNRAVANGEYAQKRQAYVQSGYQLTSQIPVAAPEEWTQELLDNRQRLLARRGTHLWRADPA